MSGHQNFDVVGDEVDGYGEEPNIGYTPQHGGRGGRGGAMTRGGRGGAMTRGPAPTRGGGPGASGMLPPGAPHPPWLAQSNPFGISQPIEGLIQLPLAPTDNVGAMTAAVTSVKFLGRVQRPFRGERVVATLTRVGTTAASPTVRAVNGIVVGVVPQQAQVGNTNLAEWAATSFGVRMAMNVAYPGVDITCNTILVGALTSPDEIFIDLTIYGRYVG